MNIHKTYARNLCELIKSHPLVGSRGMPFGLFGFIGACSPGLLKLYALHFVLYNCHHMHRIRFSRLHAYKWKTNC